MESQKKIISLQQDGYILTILISSSVQIILYIGYSKKEVKQNIISALYQLSHCRDRSSMTKCRIFYVASNNYCVLQQKDNQVD